MNSRQGDQPDPTTAGVDPVCGMTVDPATARFSAMHGGIGYHFCSQGCQQKFTAEPGRYLRQTAAVAMPPAAMAGPATAADGSIYTCPMHPQIRQDHPGSCPLCGMALEPLLPSADEANPELADFSRRFWWTPPLSPMIAALAMSLSSVSVVSNALRLRTRAL